MRVEQGKKDCFKIKTENYDSEEVKVHREELERSIHP